MENKFVVNHKLTRHI